MNILRNLIYMARRFKTATTLNFLGLVTAFAACYLFLTQVIYNHSYNRGLANYKQLYRVEVPGMREDVNMKWQANICRFIADELAALPQVDGMTLMESWTSTWNAK